MRDDDKMLDLPPEFGSGVIGVCDICGTRQAVVVLSKERFKLCVVDFLNKTWLKTTQKPGAPLPLYRSERVWYPSDSAKEGRAPGILLIPTKAVRHPGILITPDVYGITTTLLDGAIRFAREGFEVLLPDVSKTDAIGPGHHIAMRAGVRVRGGIGTSGRKVRSFTSLFEEALAYLRARDLVDPNKTAVFGVSYGASLALSVAARDTRLGAVVLAYPMPVQPVELSRLVTAPLLYIGGTSDRWSARARHQLDAARGEAKSPFQFEDVTGAKHGFLSRDLSAYDLAQAEHAWTQIVAFLKRQLLPPPPKPPAAPPPKAVQAATTVDAKPSAVPNAAVTAGPVKPAPAA
ncbi:MAG: dienelactone hydrolase family protein [Thermoplasmata archaeon]|nr:dienelactone hydrolase family protein [Thermoplasmata archaeon]